MKKLLWIILMIAVMMCMSGCSFLTIGGGGDNKTTHAVSDNVRRDVNELHSEPAPIKSLDHEEAEKAVLNAIDNKVEAANITSTEPPVKDELTQARRLIKALQSSLGMPTDVQSIKNVNEVSDLIDELMKDNQDFREKEYEWRKEQQDNIEKIQRLQGQIDVQIEKEKGLFSTIKTWIWIAIILSIIIAVCLPGGMAIVSRFWKKTGEVFINGAKGAAKHVGDMSQQLARYMQTLDEKEQRKLKDYLNDMSHDAKKFWDDVRTGANPLHKMADSMPDTLKRHVEKRNGSGRGHL